MRRFLSWLEHASDQLTRWVRTDPEALPGRLTECEDLISCWDRVIVHGTLPGFGHSAGMTSYLEAHGIRIFDYTKFAEPLRDQIRSNAERTADG